mmetsp:Transcript_11306/g.29868  ORF Transcript_11306/g.29868 Transcript_11306/m.29868 type:complete len:90 (+) Transcript_11306:540-809(+)
MGPWGKGAKGQRSKGTKGTCQHSSMTGLVGYCTAVQTTELQSIDSRLLQVDWQLPARYTDVSKKQSRCQNGKLSAITHRASCITHQRLM